MKKINNTENKSLIDLLMQIRAETEAANKRLKEFEEREYKKLLVLQEFQFN